MLQHYKKRGLIGAAVFLAVPLVVAISGVMGLLDKMPRFAVFGWLRWE